MREYGVAGPVVILVHGGPGAPGSLGPVARELARSFRVLEPFQRGSGDEPLTVGRHVADLEDLVRSRAAGGRPAVVGHSWGAMLALAWASAHPDGANPLVLVGCGTFDVASRERFRELRDARLDDAARRRIASLASEDLDPGAFARAMDGLLRPAYVYDGIEEEDAGAVAESEPGYDARANAETWQDMLRLQAEGVYPAAFASIRSPVLMLHGDFDPHPGAMIHATLAPWLAHLEYCELARSGHEPWRERHARDEFFARLRTWLARHAEEA
jgi:pimeloyl-ACP methyl ester carboxylesterase